MALFKHVAACLAVLPLPALIVASPVIAAEEEAPARSSLVPDDFQVPTLVEAEGFKLVPLGPELVKVDYEAYMSSIDHLQRTFTRSTAWPHPGITDADAMVDMQTEQARFAQRKSFAFAILTPDGTRERGCVYVQPSPVPGYDAVVRMWVTKAEYEAGFEAELLPWVENWLKLQWPFTKVAFPGHTIGWPEWNAMAKKP